MTVTTNPLTEADLTKINQALVDLDDAEELAQKAQRAEIGDDEQMERIRESRKKLLKIKQNFFPNG